MTYGGKQFASAFRTVRKNTIQIAEDIPESSYGFSAAPDVRTVGQMLAHIAVSTRIFEELNKTPRVTTLVGYDFLGFHDRLHAEEAKPRTKAEIIELLRTEGDRIASWMDTVTPEILAEEDEAELARSKVEWLERFHNAVPRPSRPSRKAALRAVPSAPVEATSTLTRLVARIGPRT